MRAPANGNLVRYRCRANDHADAGRNPTLAGSPVTIYEGATALGRTTVNAQGQFALILSLPSGTHVLYPQYTDVSRPNTPQAYASSTSETVTVL